MDTTIKQAPSMFPTAMPPVVAQTKQPQLVMEQTPCFSPLVNMVWPTIKPCAEELAAQSFKEFDVYDVYKEIYFGSALLFMGYIVDDREAYEKGDPSVKKTFVGYVLVKLEKNAAHIWQVYIVEAHRHTNVFELGYAWLEAELKKIGAKQLSMSVSKLHWDNACKKIGFTETFTLYRKDL